MPKTENNTAADTAVAAPMVRRDAKSVRDKDQGVIKAAQNLHESILRIDTCRDEIKAAEEKLANAQRRCDNASHDDDEVALVDAVLAAEMDVRRAHVALKVAEAKRKNCEKAIVSAKHHALMAFVADARARRLAACEKLDELAAMVAEAMNDFGTASIEIAEATSHGFLLPFKASELGWQQGNVPNLPDARYADSERALWA